MDAGMRQTIGNILFHTCNTQMITDSIVVWETRLSICRSGLSQDSVFAGDFEDSESTSGGILCIFGSRTFFPLPYEVD